MANDSKWREFEKLVTLIESHMSPNGAKVKSPDRIPDKVTGKPREVDASIRYQVGSAPILVTIECRDRVSTEDVTWIEQLATKRDSIGASATIAVSSSGFSEPARALARAKNIEVRVMEEVSDDAIRESAQHLSFVVVLGTFGVVDLRFRGVGDEGDIATDVLRRVQSDFEYAFVRLAVEDKLVGLSDLLKKPETRDGHGTRTHDQPITVRVPPHSTVTIPVNQSFSWLFDGVIEDVPPVTVTVSVLFEVGEASISTDSGAVGLIGIDVDLALAQRTFPSQLGRMLSYKMPTSTIATIQEQEVTLPDGRVIRAVAPGGYNDSGGG